MMEPSSSTSSSSSSSNEVATINSDELLSRTLFPEEIWIQLIQDKFLKKKNREEDISDDYKLFLNSSIYYRELLLDQRTLLLFPEVFPIIIPYLLLPTKYDKENKDYSLICYEYAPPIEFTEILLNMRAVCSTWKVAADKLFRHGNIRLKDPSPSASSPFNFSLFECEQVVNNIDNVSFNRPREVTECLDIFSPAPPRGQQPSSPKITGSPFLSGIVSIKIHNGLYGGRWPDYPDLIVTLLNIFGHDIRILDLELKNDFDSMLECFGKLRECLEKTSNLVKLKVTLDGLTQATFNGWGEVELDLEGNGEEGTQQLAHFPKLDELEIISLPNVVFKKLVQRNTQVSKLKVSCEYNHEYMFIFSLSFPNLEELAFKFSSLEDIVSLGGMEIFDWPLKKLSLSFSRSIEFVRWSQLFAVVGKLGGTLEVLVVDSLPVAKDEEEYKTILEDTAGGKLNLPRIKRLELHFSQNIYLEFLMSMGGSLEQLRLYKEWTPAFKPNSKEFHDPFSNEKFMNVDDIQEGKMEEEKMWKVFPNMERVFISWGNGDSSEFIQKK